MDNPLPEIKCDNLQTIRIITVGARKLQTALKIVDFHNCWAKQEYLKDSFKVVYRPSSKILADGFTKLPPRQKLIGSRELLRLKDTQDII